MEPPELVLRPAFDRWLHDRNIDYTAAGRELRCSRETVRRYCLPFNDPDRRFPNKVLLPRIIELTTGEITGHDFLEPVEPVERAA